MATKYDIPDTYLDEYKEYQRLFLLGSSGRGAEGAGTFSSTTSSVDYVHTGGNDLFSQLQTAIGDYLVTASDFNGKVDQSQFTTLETDLTNQVDQLEADVKDGSYNYYVTTNVGNDYSITTGQGYTSYIAGMSFKIKFNADSTGNISLNVDGIGANNVLLPNGDNVDEVYNNGVYHITHNGTNFIMPSSPAGVFGTGEDGILNTTGNVTYTSTLDGAPAVKQYKSITVNAGHTLTVSSRCGGLVLYSKGDVDIYGTVDMNYKVGKGEYAIAIMTAKDGLIQMPVGGAGGDGGDSATAVMALAGLGGTGSAGTQSGGGVGGGGGGGAAQSSGEGQAAGGTGGNSYYQKISGTTGGTGGAATDSSTDGGNGSFASGGGGGGSTRFAAPTQAIGGTGGSSVNGGAGGGGGGCVLDNTNPLGGVSAQAGSAGVAGGGAIAIVCNGNLTIHSGGKITSLGGAGGDGGDINLPANGNATGGGGAGGSGGGCVLLLHKGTYTNNGSISLAGGAGGSGGVGTTSSYDGNAGSSGGTGNSTIQQLT